MKAGYIAAIVLLLMPIIAVADPICRIEDGYYPDLPYLIKNADAIVILRIGRHLSDFNNRDSFFSTRKCFVYQTLKGGIPRGSRITVRLYSIEGSFANPYAYGSKYLIFLMKNTNENEPTDYRVMTDCGAQTPLSPSGLEKKPEGDTIEEQVKNLVKDAIDYQTKRYQLRMKFLNSMLSQSEDAEQSPGSNSLEVESRE